MATPVQDDAGDRHAEELRFRASLISSAGVHAVVVLAAVFGPLIWPRPPLMPNVTPVRLLRLPAPEPAPPAPAPEQEAPETEVEAEPEPEPEPIPAVTTPPEPIPRSIEDLRRQQEREQAEREAEEQRRREEEAERRRREAEAEAERQRQAEEERRRAEEEARRQPQKATRKSRQQPQRQTAQRQAIDITGAETSQRSFTVEEFPFVDYVVRIRDMIAARWNPPERPAYALERRVEVFFRIGRSGRLLVQPRNESTSGDTLFDQAALRAIASAAPFPPLPREYEGQSLGVRFAFVQE